MPKKGKVNKLARMSDEERARYLQHRADMEEEARRRKRELIVRFIKNKLDKEEAYSRINTAKLNQTWRYVLRKVKCKQMALEIQGMMSSFDYLMERKDRLIYSLMRAVEDSDEQHRRAFQAHTETLSYFLGIGSERLNKLQNEYEYQKNELLETWDKEYFAITGNQDGAEFKLRLIIFVQGNDFNNQVKQHELGIATAKNDARLEHEEDMWDFRRPKEMQVEHYWSRLREVYATYLEQHNDVIGHYHSLREKDDFYQRDIAKNELQIQQATETLISLQREWMKNTATMDYKLKKMNRQKEKLSQKYWELKRATKIDQSRGSEKMTDMVEISQDVIKKLQQAKGKLNKVLQMSEICRKYENEDDKFSNFGEENNSIDTTSFEYLNKDMINECIEYKKLDKFLLKMNTVKVQTICLKAEKAKLQKENGQLKNYIRRYLTDLALRNDGDQRPVSVKPQSDVKKMEGNPIKTNRPVTCIEGVLSNAVQHEKRMKILERKNKELGGIRSYPRLQCWM